MPTLLVSQVNTWSVEASLGGNESFNRMILLDGQVGRMKNPIITRGYWEIQSKYQFAKKSSIIFGINQTGYAYSYQYEIESGSGGGSKASYYIWGFPIGIENNWISGKKLVFNTSYGFKYRINNSGSPFALVATESIYDPLNNLIFKQDLKEYDFKSCQNLFSIFISTQIGVNIIKNGFLFFKVNYNQGINESESFKFTAENYYADRNLTTEENYQYYTRASYLSFGVGFCYSFNKKKNNMLKDSPLPNKK